MKKTSRTTRSVRREALRYRKAGLSIVPIATSPDPAFRTKRPDVKLLPLIRVADGSRKRSWKPFQDRRASKEEILEWFPVIERYPDEKARSGIGIICGEISGNLEVIDIDSWQYVKPWRRLVRMMAPGLYERLVRVKSPRPGLHIYYRCSEISGYERLAQVLDQRRPKTVIEKKGEGGYTLSPACPGTCHPTGRTYELVNGDLLDVPEIAPAERQILLDAARALNEVIVVEQATSEFVSTITDGNRPGDKFNREADWPSILEPHGWSWGGTGGDGIQHWRRPGKTEGISATIGCCGFDVLYVFSGNAYPFEPARGYTKFHAFALLNHAGNWHAAAAALNPRPPRRLRGWRGTSSFGKRSKFER